LPEKAGQPDHVKLVEVVCRDRQELDALQQWMRFVAGLRQDACIERQPAQLAVQI
jgi:hypothetical protein